MYVYQMRLFVYRKHIESTHTQHKAIQTINNNYLGEFDRHQDPYCAPPPYQPNYWSSYDQYNHTHTHHHWYYSQNNYYSSYWY